jgi:hypothetical protein
VVATIAVTSVLLSGCYIGVTTSSGGGNLRAGWYTQQTTLTPGLVSGGNFGEMWNANVTGQVYAQPVVHNGTVVAVTETNDIYGLNEVTGVQTWHRNLGTPFNPQELACNDLLPTIGITGTPTIDPATNTAYFVAKRYLSGSSGPSGHFAHAVDVTTGAERPGFPVQLQGTAANDPTLTFDGRRHLQRPGLLLMDGVVYAAFGSHCGALPHQGWIIGFTTSGQVSTLWTDDAGGNGARDGAGIWQSGGGIVSDAPGEMVVSSGNGSIPGVATPGSTPPTQLGESVIRLRVQPDKTLRAVDFFMPYDAADLNAWDADLGSGAPVALPTQYFGTPSHPRLGLQIGKQGYLYLLDMTNLGGYQQGPSGSDGVLKRLGPFGGAWSKPAVWGGDGGYVYISYAYGQMGAYKYGLDGAGKPTFTEVGKSADSFGFGSGSPVVSSNGTQSGSALVWIIWSPDGGGENAQLRAYDPIPVGGRLNLRYSAPIGTASKFSVPVISNNRVILGTRDGRVKSFGSPISTPLAGSPLSFPNTTVGQSSTQTLTLTANIAVNVTSISSNSPQFTVAAPSPPLPAQLSAGQTLAIPVTFTPTAAAPASATLTVNTNVGPATFTLSGTGLSSGAQLVSTPPAVSLGGAIVNGPPVTGSATLRNIGSQPLTVQAVTLPTAPFSANDVPAVGSTIGAGAEVTVSVAFAPTTIGLFTDELTLTTTGGNVTIPVSGTATSAPHMTLSATMLPYGDVPVGGTRSMSFIVGNDGGGPLTITRSKPPSGVFSATTDIPEGTVIAPGGSITGTVRFAPTALGAASATWDINGNDGSGARVITFTGNGVSASLPNVPAAGGWQLNGFASMSGSDLILTPNEFVRAGSAFWPTPISTDGLTIGFDATIDQGDGADGMTFTFGNPSAGAAPTSIGSAGGGLGYSGIPGVTVTLDTHQNGSDPNGNFVGIATSASGDTFNYAATNTTIPLLDNSTRRVVLRYSGGVLQVSIDGVVYLTQTVSVAPLSYVGWTAATGGLTNRHRVTNVSFSYS